MSGTPEEKLEEKIRIQLRPLRKELDEASRIIQELTDNNDISSDALIKQLAKNTSIFTRIKEFVEGELKDAEKYPSLYTEHMINQNIKTYEQVIKVLEIVENWKTKSPTPK